MTPLHGGRREFKSTLLYTTRKQYRVWFRYWQLRRLCGSLTLPQPKVKTVDIVVWLSMNKPDSLQK